MKRVLTAAQVDEVNTRSRAAWRKPLDIEPGGEEVICLTPSTPKKRSKYGNTPTVVHGIYFDSKGEAKRYSELVVLEGLQQIFGLRCQVKFGLTVRGQLIGAYEADFVYREGGASGQLVVEDYKGSSDVTKTALYEWKKKHLRAEHGIAIRETGR